MTEFGIKPEELRKMPIYDVYMLQYAKVTKYINSLNEDRPKDWTPAQGGF